MAQKEVEDIFAKSMKKSEFKRASTVRLAREFLSKNKAITSDWRTIEPMNALVEEDDDTLAD